MSTDSMSTKFRVPPPACGSLTAPGDGEGARQRAWRRRRRKGLLTLARRNPHRVLKDRRCHKPEFCREFLDLCDGKALEQPRKALKFAPVATELAEKVGDRHLIHRARGIFVHAYIARRRWKEAGEVLNGYQEAALECCPSCASEWLRRAGDLLVETRDAERAHEFLELSLQVNAADLDADTRGRIRFVRGIAHHFLGDPERAIRDAGKALQELSLETPRGYFMDTLAFVACFLKGAGRRHDEAALEYLGHFRERLMGLKDWAEVRLRMSWVEGQVHARLGHRRRAADRLERVRVALLKSGPAHHALAVTLDLCLHTAHRWHDSNERAIARMLSVCRRRAGLDASLARRLGQTYTSVGMDPERAALYLAKLRRSFIVPVPGLLAEKDSEE